MTDRTSRSRARGIHYLRRAGNGTTRTLVLLHGIGSNAGSFAALLAALPETIDAIAWDAPGYGQSEPLAITIPSPRDYADMLANLPLDLPRAIFDPYRRRGTSEEQGL